MADPADIIRDALMPVGGAPLAALTELEQREFNANAQRAIANKRAEAAEAEAKRLQKIERNNRVLFDKMKAAEADRDRLADTLRDARMLVSSLARHSDEWGNNALGLVSRIDAALDRHTKANT